MLGAGFTKNFGGLLAEEMWIEIFNHEKVQEQPKIKELMLNDFNYESIYNNVLGNELYSNDEQNAIISATTSAYDHIDNILKKHFLRRSPSAWDKNIDKLLHSFGERDSCSFIFTLNQDLFIERFYQNPRHSSSCNPKLSIPGINTSSNWFMNRDDFPRYHARNNEGRVPTEEEVKQYFNLKPEDYCTLPTPDMLNQGKKGLLADGNYFLIKLHGSYNWISSSDKRAMVIGTGKAEQIKKECLLEKYFNIFRKVLSQKQRRLLIIGYGFGDDHINHELSESIKNHGLKIYILSPESPREVKKKLCDQSASSDDTKTIWKGVAGYFQCVEDVLLKGDNEVKKEHFYEVFFNIE